MREITRYEADDGSIWTTPAAALERDALVRECRAAVEAAGLKDVPDSSDFANGGGYVQQPKGSRERLLDFLRSKGAHRDSDGPVGDLLHRARRINEEDREFGQPYFALHPDEARGGEIGGTVA